MMVERSEVGANRKNIKKDREKMIDKKKTRAVGGDKSHLMLSEPDLNMTVMF